MSKPATPPKGASTGTLMDNQDRVGKGDSEDNVKVPTQILLPMDLKKRVQEYARAHGTTLTWVVIEGIYLKLNEE